MLKRPESEEAPRMVVGLEDITEIKSATMEGFEKEAENSKVESSLGRERAQG